MAAPPQSPSQFMPVPTAYLMAQKGGGTQPHGLPVAFPGMTPQSMTPQGMPQTPLAEFVRLTVDGAEAVPEVVERKRPNGPGLADRYHLLALPDLAAGKHTATVVARDVKTKREVTQTVLFTV